MPPIRLFSPVSALDVTVCFRRQWVDDRYSQMKRKRRYERAGSGRHNLPRKAAATATAATVLTSLVVQLGPKSQATRPRPP